jgi:hypothetical protein
VVPHGVAGGRGEGGGVLSACCGDGDRLPRPPRRPARCARRAAGPRCAWGAARAPAAPAPTPHTPPPRAQRVAELKGLEAGAAALLDAGADPVERRRRRPASGAAAAVRHGAARRRGRGPGWGGVRLRRGARRGGGCRQGSAGDGDRGGRAPPAHAGTPHATGRATRPGRARSARLQGALGPRRPLLAPGAHRQRRSGAPDHRRPRRCKQPDALRQHSPLRPARGRGSPHRTPRAGRGQRARVYARPRANHLGCSGGTRSRRRCWSHDCCWAGRATPGGARAMPRRCWQLGRGFRVEKWNWVFSGWGRGVRRRAAAAPLARAPRRLRRGRVRERPDCLVGGGGALGPWSWRA